LRIWFSGTAARFGDGVVTLGLVRQSLLAVAAFALVVAACAGEESAVSAPSSIVPSTTPAEVPSTEEPGSGVPLMSGSFQIPAANAFDDPGFHETFVLTGAVPAAAGGVSGELIVRLFDVGRPDQTCDRDHPLSGCATVDWSDFENRPGVPVGGVFDNHLSVVSTSGGPVELFLSERRGLAATPDQYSPT
jgi:hypothetical protein